MRWWSILAVLLLLPIASAQVPHPHESVVHHPLTIQSEMQAIAAKNPSLISMDSFGTSTAGFPLWYLDFAHPEADKATLPVFYLDANHHGNEQLGMESLLIFLDELADWSLTEEGEERLSEVRIVGAPMINPDGTGRNNRVNANLVDLNRNYDYHWGLYGTSDTPSPAGGTYRGESPQSEPESAANAAFMAALRPWVYLSMHTGSHDIVLPWRAYDGDGNELDGPIPDWPAYEQYLARIEEVSGLGYRDPSGAGESISYAYGHLGAISLIVEVDQLQSELIVEGRPERLEEEVEIFWMTVQEFDRIGGHLEWIDGSLCNTGWGNATGVVMDDHGHQDVLSDVPAGACLEVDHVHEGATISYHRTMQGDTVRTTASLPVPAAVVPVLEAEQEAPLPLALGLAALCLAFALRRRAA